MSRRPIGYYVHHHGAGHLARARAIRRATDWPVTLLGTGIGDQGVDVADDRLSLQFDGADGADNRPEALHYAPVDHEGVRARVARIAAWIKIERPALLVVDVSVEIAMLARLASVPTIYVRLNGTRTDAAHLDAFRGALGLLAPFHAKLDRSPLPDWVKDKTFYAPGITASVGCVEAPGDDVLVVIGRGGPRANGLRIAAAARACPDRHWRVIGPIEPVADPPSNLEIEGWVADAERQIARAGIVIGAAGDGLVSAVLAAGRPFVCIPEERPYGEQAATAAGLDAARAALVLTEWPSPTSWPSVLDEALAMPRDAGPRLHDPDGLAKVSAWLERQAEMVSFRHEQAA